MAMLIWSAGGAPPFGPGTAARVVVATWFQWITSLASVPTRGAADALDTPSVPKSAPTATVMTATDRLRDIVLPSPSTRPEFYMRLRQSLREERVIGVVLMHRRRC